MRMLSLKGRYMCMHTGRMQITNSHFFNRNKDPLADMLE